MPELKIEEAGSLSKYERQKLLRLYTQLTVLYATWQKLADYQYQMLDSFYIQKIHLQKSILAARKFKKMRAVA